MYCGHLQVTSKIIGYILYIKKLIELFSKLNVLYFLCNRHVGLHFFPLWRCGPTRAMASSFLRFLDHTQRHTTLGRIPLDEWSAHRRDLYLTRHNSHNRQTSMPPVGFKPTVSTSERPQTHALDRAATGTQLPSVYYKLIACAVAIIHLYYYVVLPHISAVLSQL